ncbi:MAG: hypothetical protein GEV28_12900 [Actinophytocola sp.]|uniref:hypothetical protein n=1 Tax=Actinophytocola sp. TaxID=1872138 RepID=UPI00132C3721|nr:hypothetical protein [Actinophytocola sp.]MPZ81238.1 hypothetical protein [Actinophytocola sp.]
MSVGPIGGEPIACRLVFDRLRKTVIGADIPTEPVLIRLPDQRFGMFTVTGEWDPRVVTITGPWRAVLTLSSVLALPNALKRRLIWNVPPPRITPMRRDAVRLDVDGRQAPLDCGRRAMRRATYDARATIAGREYLLRHERRWRARLERDGRPVARLSTSDHGRSMSAVYQPSADATDASVGVALGMVLGVGAPGFIRNLLANLP